MIVFVTDYGSTQHTVATPEPETEPDVKATVYQAKDDQEHLSVRIEGQPCQDTMSDNLFEAIVTVTLNDKTYRGCGRALH